MLPNEEYYQIAIAIHYTYMYIDSYLNVKQLYKPRTHIQLLAKRYDDSIDNYVRYQKEYIKFLLE